MDEGIGLTTLPVKDEECRDSVNAAESVDDILIANDQWKSGAGAFEKPLHALAADTVTPILEPVDGDDGYARFAVFPPDRVQGLKFPTAGRTTTGEKRHSNRLPAGLEGATRWRSPGLGRNPLAVSSRCLTGLARLVLQIHSSAGRAQIRPVETPIVTVVGKCLPAIQRGFQSGSSITSKMFEDCGIGIAEIGTKPNV